jgi:acyl-CoA synthetase (AMP-forming)/AMP-acid ligase II
MSEITDGTTIGAIFSAAVSTHGGRPFLAVPTNDARSYLPSGFEITYGEVGKRVDELAAVYRQAGYGLCHRVATLLENRPEYVMHKLALNSIGVCCVPINPDYRAAEIAYLIEHSEPDVILTLGSREGQIKEALAHSAHKPPIIVAEEFAAPLAKSQRRRLASFTRQAPPDGRRAASCHTATRSHPAPGMRRSEAWRVCAPARTASTIRCRCIM